MSISSEEKNYTKQRDSTYENPVPPEEQTPKPIIPMMKI
jgi:hypothetical protein